MAATQFSSSTPFKQEPDVDMNTFIDFSGGNSYSSPKQDSFLPRPALETSELPDSEDFQSFSGPSHEYERYQQQTGLPPAALSHVHAFIDEESQTVSQSSISALGSFEFPTSALNEDTSFDGFFGDTMDESSREEQNAQPAQPQINQDAMQMSQQRPSLQEPSYRSNTNDRLSIPNHGQYATLQRVQSVTTLQTLHPQQTLQASPGPSRPASQQQFDPEVNVDETIHRVLAKIRHDSVQSSTLTEDDSSSTTTAASLAKAKKDEEEMDEDEKLLASEEGKKLSSKERRQLRNKVSARAFRHRRKEYIVTLEEELKVKSKLLTEILTQNHRLKNENEQMTAFMKDILAKPAFRGTLEDIAADHQFQPRNLSISAPPRREASNQMMAPIPPANMQNFGMVTSPMGFQASQQSFSQSPQSFSQSPQISMQPARTSGQDFDMSAIGGLNLQGGNEQWANTNSQNTGTGAQWNNDPTNFDFNNFQAFAVLELPAGPSFQELNSEALSGKGSDVVSTVVDANRDPKRDFPTIRESIRKSIEKEDVPLKVAPVTEPEPTNSAFDLFSDVPAATSHELPPATGWSGKYELIVLPSNDSSKTPEERLEGMCQVLDASVQRLQSLV